MKTKKLLLGTFLFLSSFSFSQGTHSLWQKESATNTIVEKKKNAVPNNRLYALDINTLKAELIAAPKISNGTASRSSSVVVSFPDDKNEASDYRIFENSVMDPASQALYPDTRSYVGVSLSDPGKSIYFSVSSIGLRAMTLSSDKSAVYIRPSSTDNTLYSVFSDDEYQPKRSNLSKDVVEGDTPMRSVGGVPGPVVDDGKIRTFRLAVGSTVEFTNLCGGSITNVIDNLNSIFTDVNAIFERDFSIRIQLITSYKNAIYTGSAFSDWFSNDSIGASLTAATWPSELKSKLDMVAPAGINASNYEIGMLFAVNNSTGLVGQAQLGSAQVDSTKAKAFAALSSLESPTDPEFYKTIAHEMAHQFGARHTFTIAPEALNFSQVEPLSGSTLMSYAGLTASNVQATADPYFHSVSISEVRTFVSGKGNSVLIKHSKSALGSPNANVPSTIILPNSTPFVIYGVLDSNSPVGSTYSSNFEEVDLGSPGTSIPSASQTSGPQFRSYPAVNNPYAYAGSYRSSYQSFPKPSSVLLGDAGLTQYNDEGTMLPVEQLPSVSRNMYFRFSTFEKVPYSGMFEQFYYSKDIQVTTSGNPLRVTSQNTSTTAKIGDNMTVTWTPGGTNAGSINCSSIKIVFFKTSDLQNNKLPADIFAGFSSTNIGGTTLSKVLTVPNYLIPGEKYRIAVVGIPATGGYSSGSSGDRGAIFYDISNADITIALPTPVLTGNITAPNTTTANLTWTIPTPPAGTPAAGTYGYAVYKGITFLGATTGLTNNATVGVGEVANFTVKRYYNPPGVTVFGPSTVYSAASNVVTLTGYISAPTIAVSYNNTATTPCTGFMTVSWNGVVGAANYMVYVDGALVGMLTASSPSSTYQYFDCLSAKGASHTYQIKVVSTTGSTSSVFSPLSNLVTAIKPIEPVLADPNTAKIIPTFSWTIPSTTGVTGYKIYGLGVPASVGPGTLSFTVPSSATAGVTYNVKVTSVYGTGTSAYESAYSNVVIYKPATQPTFNYNDDLNGTTFTLKGVAPGSGDGASSVKLFRNGTLVSTAAAGSNFNIAQSGLTSGTKYTYKGVSINSLGYASDTTVTYVRMLDAPILDPVTYDANDAPVLHWTNDPHPAYVYSVINSRYEVSLNGTISGFAILPNASKESLLPSDLIPTAGAINTLKMRCIDAWTNRTIWSNSITFTPIAPPVITAENIKANAADIKWTVSSTGGIAEFELFRDGVSIYTTTSVGTSNIYNASSLNPCQSYVFKVRAKGTDGRYTPFSEITVTPTPAIPTLYGLLNGNEFSADYATTVNLNWSMSNLAGITGYQIFKNGMLFSTELLGTSSKQMTGLTPNTSYTFTIRSVAGSSCTSGYSTSITLTPRYPKIDLTASLGSDSKSMANLSWTLNYTSGVSNYVIYRNGTPLAPQTDMFKNFTGLTSGTPYTFKVVAFNSAGSIVSESDNKYVTTTGLPTPTLFVDAITDNSVTVSWTIPSGATSPAKYTLYVDNAEWNNPTLQSQTVSALASGSTHTFRVRSSNSTGSDHSNSSNTVTVTTTSATSTDGGNGSYCGSYGTPGTSNATDFCAHTLFAYISDPSEGILDRYPSLGAGIESDVNSSDNFYINNTGYVVQLPKNTVIQFAMSTFLNNGGISYLYSKIWIDYNDDGDFNDSGELVASTPPGSPYLGISFDGYIIVDPIPITIPNSVNPGTKRVRVIGSASNTFGPCSTGFVGGTRDFKVNIYNRSFIPFAEGENNDTTSITSTSNTLTFDVYPNPIDGDVLTVSNTTGNENYCILNVNGQELAQGSLTDNTVPVSKLSPGIYVLKITSNSGEVGVKRFVKK